ncbi:hypothetical protein [Streptosporangium sp. V21-05]|uniref:hypothetical protein n=1 Tax=Streptosporangium sp. V21-05 TaxID=3446115 RepID=UPI003F52C1F1
MTADGPTGRFERRGPASRGRTTGVAGPPVALPENDDREPDAEAYQIFERVARAS